MNNEQTIREMLEELEARYSLTTIQELQNLAIKKISWESPENILRWLEFWLNEMEEEEKVILSRGAPQKEEALIQQKYSNHWIQFVKLNR